MTKEWSPDLVLWRISNHADLDGLGGLFANARWHSSGRRVVYLAPSPAAALIEIIVHLELPERMLPDTYQLLKVRVPDSVSRESIAGESLPEDWEHDTTVTRARGDRWLAGLGSALLEVPSAVVPETANWMLNPVHGDAREIRIESNRRYPYDSRLFRKRLR